MRVLLIGSDTSLGLAVEQYLHRWGRHEVSTVTMATSRWKSDRHAKKAVRRIKPDVIVDLRLQAEVDSGERLTEAEVERCHWLAKACLRNDSIYFLVSSARVFSGEHERPYSIAEAPDGEDALGLLLRRAEQLVRASCERHLILRLGPVFSHRGRNALTTLLEKLSEGGALVLDNSLSGCPVPAEDAARVLAGMLDQLSAGAEPWGFFHYCSADATNCYEFAEAILASASQFSEFSPDAVSLHEEETGRRLSRRLDSSRLRNTFAIRQEPWRASVADVVKSYFQTKTAREP